MALSQIYTAVAGNIITAARWNNEFGNIYGNGTDVAFPVTKAVSIGGFTLTLDASGTTTLVSTTVQAFVMTPGSKSGTPGVNGNMLTLVGGTFNDTNTAGSGTAAQWNGAVLRSPTVSAANTLVTTTLASTLYVEPPIASTNQTFTAGYALRLGGMLGLAKGTDVVAASTLPLPPNGNMADCTGTTTITAIPATQAGTMLWYRFTGTGLNITYNAVSMITQWSVTYRTVPNEILAFLSLGSGNYTCWSVNGPKEIPGTTILFNGTALPSGYLEEDGTAVLRSTYAGLFSKIGTVHGVGDGSTTFNLPLTAGLADIGLDSANSIITAASTNGANAATLGGKGGAQTHTLAISEMPAHTHPGSINTATSGGGTISGAYGTAVTFTATPINVAVLTQGGGGAHSNTQPWITRHKCIRF